MKTIVITGHRGFIGGYLTKTCLDKGWMVYGIDKITYASNNFLEKYQNHPNYKANHLDICTLKSEYLPEVDYVINAAAETHVDNSIAGNDNFLKSNINGVHNLLEVIRNKGHNKPIFLQFSTDEVYGDISKGSHKETDILKPSNPYSATKASADMLVMGWARTYNLPYIIIRPTNNYGIGQYVEKLIPRSIKCLSLNKQIPLHNNGLPIRSWLHAQDTADAIITIIESGVKNEIFNIGGSCEKTNKEVVYSIIKEYYRDTNFKLDSIIDFSYNRQGQDIRYSLDDSKLRKLGWSPKKDLYKELPSIVEFYKNNYIW